MKKLLAILFLLGLFAWFFFCGAKDVKPYTPGKWYVPPTMTPKWFTTIGEYSQIARDSIGRLVCFTGNTGLNGIGSGSAGVPTPASIPGVTFTVTGNTLHGGAALDNAGNAWAFGVNDQGECGLGDRASHSAWTKITVDARGLPFTNITIVQGSYAQVGSQGAQGCHWVKHGTSSDTVFYSGSRTFGMGANGTTASDTVTAPTIAWSLPSGRRVTSMTAGVVVVCLLDDGTVWDWGANGVVGYLGRTGSYTTPGQVTGFDGAITQICGGAAPGVLALSSTGKLWGWSQYSGYMGNAANTSYTSPHDLTTNISNYIFNGTSRTSYSVISGNSVCFHIIANDSTLWGWGDNGMGSIGNGVEANMASPGGTSAPWSIDPSAILVLAQTRPVQVTNKHNFVMAFSGYQFAFYFVALDANGDLWMCGRNKVGLIPNGQVECFNAHGDHSNNYPDTWDVISLTRINPYGITSAFSVNPLGCKTGQLTSFCDLTGGSSCPFPSTTITAAIVGGNTGTTTSSSITVDGTASTTTGHFIRFLWSSTDGEIEAESSPVLTWNKLTVGIHTATLTVTDDAYNTSSVSFTATVTSTACSNCVQTKIKINFH